MIEKQKIRVVEVGPRDGFQNIKTFIPTETKYEILAAMFAAGVSEMEFTSFVSPKAIPQMADAKELASRKVPVHTILPLVEYAVFYGLRADEAELNVSVSASLEGERLLVSVDDDGPGLGEDELAALFSRFKGAHEGEAIQMNLLSARRRLREFYGAEGGINISATTGQGTHSLVVFPEKNLTGGL